MPKVSTQVDADAVLLALLQRPGAVDAVDDIDRRILENVIEGRGKHIDSEQEVGGYPKHAETRQAFVPADWDLATMEPLKPLPRRPPPRR